MTPAKLRSIRLRAGLTQQALGDRFGYCANTIRGWEHGRGSPNKLTLAAYVALDRGKWQEYICG